MAIRCSKDILEVISPSEEQGTSDVCWLQNTLLLEPEASAFLSHPGVCYLPVLKETSFKTHLKPHQYFYSMGVGKKSKVNLEIKLEISTTPLT